MDWFNHFYAWACERLYYEFAWSYDWVSWLVSLGAWSSWRRVALDYLQDTRNATPRVLELGFGTGELLLALAQRDIQVYGLELSPAMHKITATKLRNRGLKVNRVRALAQALPFVEGSFDNIIATFPAPYILQLDTLQECARLLRKPQPATGLQGGRLIIVGLWVAAESGNWRRYIPLFYGTPSEALLHHIQQRFAAAGLAVTITEQRTGSGWLGVVIGEATAVTPRNTDH
ncbi:MAG: class I SAM-dependent methyltransferase [Caldilineaceae bacterium]